MRPSGSDKALFVGAMLALTVSSVGLKAAADPANDAAGLPAGQIERSIMTTLNDQGFSTVLRPGKFQSAVIFGKRNGCRVSARDARGGTSVMALYARDAKPIGPVQYLYRGQTFASPPMLRMRLDGVENQLLSRVGVRRPVAIPVALATSEQCRGKIFRLADLRMPD